MHLIVLLGRHIASSYPLEYKNTPPPAENRRSRHRNFHIGTLNTPYRHFQSLTTRGWWVASCLLEIADKDPGVDADAVEAIMLESSPTRFEICTSTLRRTGMNQVRAKELVVSTYLSTYRIRFIRGESDSWSFQLNHQFLSQLQSPTFIPHLAGPLVTPLSLRSLCEGSAHTGQTPARSYCHRTSPTTKQQQPSTDSSPTLEYLGHVVAT